MPPPTPEDPIKIWQHLHGASSHFPIALMIASFLFDLGSLLFKRPSWRIVGFWTLFTSVVVLPMAILSGFTGYLGWFGFSKWDAAGLVLHRNLSLVGAGVLFALAVWRMRRRDALKGAEFAAYLVLAALAMGVISYTGYAGAYVARGYSPDPSSWQ